MSKVKQKRKLRITNEEFINRLVNKHGDSYEALENYKGSKTKILVKHKICGHRWKVTPDSILRNGCPKCGEENRRKSNTRTTEQYKKEVFQLVGKEYTVLSEYTHISTPVQMRHNKCKNTYYQVPNIFLNSGGRCPLCSRKKAASKLRKTHEEFVQEVYELVEDEYTILSEYQTNCDYVEIIHNICSHKYKVIANNFIKRDGSRCPKCAQKLRYNTERFTNKIFKLVGNEYTLLSELESSKDSVLIRHNTCAHVFKTNADRFVNLGNRCPNCWKKKNKKRVGKLNLKTHKEFVREVFILVGDEHVVLSDYTTSGSKLQFLHKKCGKISYITPNDFLNSGTRCQHCSPSLSQGESAVAKGLTLLELEYRMEVTFKECRNKNVLPFDFAVYNNECQLALLIEYDGEHHFMPVQFGGISIERAKENLKQTQSNDFIKTSYCKENNIPLLRIPYWDFDDIRVILEKELKKHGLLKEYRELEVVGV